MKVGPEELRLAIRQLIKNPGFTISALVTLAIGLGATTAVFAIVHGVLLRPLPFPAPEDLVFLTDAHPAKSVASAGLPPARFRDLSRETGSLASVAAFYRENANLLLGERPERIPVGYTVGPLIETLGVQPVLGRGFSIEEQGSERAVVLLGHALWLRKFGGRADVIGSSVNLSRKTYTIVGVLPPEASALTPVEVWTPLPLERPMFNSDRWSRFLSVVGRLKPGTTLGQASAELETVASRWGAAHPESDAGWVPRAVPLHERLVGHTRGGLLLLGGATALLHALACLNVGALLLARYQDRAGEFALRVALGAGRSVLMRIVLTETLVLVAAGGVLGALIAEGLVQFLARSYGAVLPPGGVSAFVGYPFAYSFALLAISVGATGLWPAWVASRSDPVRALGWRGAPGVSGGKPLRARGLLVAAQFAGALILLNAVGLLGRSLHQLGNVAPGFAPEQVLTARLALPWERYSESAPFFRQVLERMAALPGVDAAGAINFLPFTSGSAPVPFQVDGTPEDPQRQTEFRCVSGDYFRTLGVPLQQGRTFDGADDDRAPRRVLVNETFVRRYLAEGPVLGRVLQLDGHPHEIIGVVGDVRHAGFSVEPGPEVFQHYLQKPWPEMALVVRGQRGGGTLAADLQRLVNTVDATQALFDVKPMTERLDGSLSGRWSGLTLLGSFAGAAVLMAWVGVYGAMSQWVRLHDRDLGIRLALGARRPQITGLVVGQGLRVAVVGMGAGLPLALGGGYLARQQFYQVSPADPMTFLLTTLVLTLAVLVACWLPARRAVRVDPADLVRGT